jgi:hypothetical protein
MNMPNDVTGQEKSYLPDIMVLTVTEEMSYKHSQRVGSRWRYMNADERSTGKEILK